LGQLLELAIIPFGTVGDFATALLALRGSLCVQPGPRA
jgi:diacylglycerol kinase family enzyme